MRKIISKLGEVFVPLILCIALLFTAYLSMELIDDLQGNARVINYTGIVRGATQRLIKKELNHESDDKLIERLDHILSGLSDGSDEFNLIRLDSEEYQALLIDMKADWEDIKSDIYKYRNGYEKQKLYERSEAYFELADKTVLTAEQYTEQTVSNARDSIITMNIIFVVMAGGCAVFTFYQEKRRKKLITAEKENMRKEELLSKRAQELLAPMNEISEMMYVCNMDTYDLLFINEAGKRNFQVDDSQLNMKCYKVLQGYDEPCSFCTNKYLKENETYSWEYTNPKLKKHYLLKDRLIEWDGCVARMEIAFDITEVNDEKNELRKRLERDNIRLECVRELYHNRDIKAAFSYVLEQMGKLFSAERSYVLLFHEDTFSNIAEWCKKGIQPQIDYLQDVPLEDYRLWIDELDKQKKLVIDDVEDLRETMPSGYELLLQQGIRNVTWVPLIKDGVLSGCIGLDNQDLKKSKMAIPFLQTIQYFVSLTMQRNDNEKMLFELSHMDKLTSFYNRNCFISDVSELKESDASIGVVYLDVNGLKEVNDCYGHDAGDNLLRKCAEIMKYSSTSERLYRIGGDEFVILYVNAEEEAFHENVQLLKNNFLSSQCHIAIGNKWYGSCEHIQDIIKGADKLMYEDKKKYYQGHHTTDRYRHNNDVLSFLSDPDVLKEKIKNKSFRVYLQPKVQVEDESITGAEALIRYQDENGIIIGPDKFIPVLEDSYFISKTDFFVFEEVCRIMRGWADQGKGAVAISSNFSKITFMDDGFVQRIEAISERYHIERKYLEIELTESASLTDFDTLITRINQIREAGFKVAMDDFGVECSNLALLSLVKFDVLKIDKGFVKDIILNERAQIIVGMMANMCSKMDIRLIAEGVEDTQQLEVLKRYGVETVQGFLFSKPISIAEYEQRYMRK